MNPFTFREKERQAFKEAQEQGLRILRYRMGAARTNITRKTIQGFRAMEKGLDKLWSGRHKNKLIKAAKIKHPQRYLGIITDKKPGIVEGITPTNDII